MTDHRPRKTHLYRCLFNLFPDAVFLEAMDGSIIECNEKALSMFGYTKEEMLGLTAKDLIHEQAADIFPDMIDEGSTTDGVFVWISSRKKNGTIFPVQYSNQVITINGEKRVLSFVRDVSEHYWRKHYLHHKWKEQIPWSTQGVPILSLTWERLGDTFVLIGFDERAITATQNRIQNYIGRSIHELYADRPDIILDITRCYEDRSILRRKTIYTLFSTGQEIIAELTYVFVPPNLVITHLEDFTERDSAEALNQSLVKSSPVGLCLVQDGVFKFTNPKLQEYTGYSDAELMDLDPYALIHPDDRSLIADLIDRIPHIDLAGKPIELRILRKDGDITWVMATATSIFYRQKQAALFNFIDFSELKQAREKIDEITALQSSMLEAIPHAVIGLDNRKIMFANHAAQPVFGWDAEELIGKSMQVLFRSKEEYDREGKKFYSTLKKKRTHSLEFTYRRKDGRDVICLTSVSRIGGTPADTRIVATHTDITEKKMAEEHLRESQRTLSTLMGNLPGMAYRCLNDRHWTMEFVSEGCFDLTGYRPAELMGNSRVSYAQLIHPHDRNMVRATIKKSLRNREHFQLIYRIITASKKVRWVWERGLGIISEKGNLIALEGFIADVTERKHAEEQLEHSRKQLSIHADHLHTLLEGERTEIAREIHDELGQILSALKMDLFWLSRKVPEGSGSVQEKIESMTQLIDSTIRTVERILVTLRPAVLDDLGLTSAVEWLAEEFQNRTGIICEAILEPTPERLITDEKISTALFRICQEALTNITRHSQATRAEIVLRTLGDQVELKVSDNGVGISKMDIKKSNSFGILGIRERANLLGGKMNIVGRKGKGSVLRVRIPLKGSDPQ
ncbi:MAG: PAS domain S-box protein [Bacteriovoracaceae bacterium]|nr:PAS domain S-box protein [Bacteriovoracaceae bacterium]HNR50338.1 PAS domain S-box protein [Deltaproteobacteria bacterium]HRR19945.1 PAS domain S-box protein [Desulfomonilia bacterium]HNU73643.1 PAS domain S-box protein [Deltaproteobacteria bacterium]HQQ15027.1 PAS domain S-box protein [Deltaproteobacteria bacterium]